VNRENQSDDILFDLLKTAGEIDKEAAPSWKQKMLAPALGLGMALAPGAAHGQQQQSGGGWLSGISQGYKKNLERREHREQQQDLRNQRQDRLDALKEKKQQEEQAKKPTADQVLKYVNDRTGWSGPGAAFSLKGTYLEYLGNASVDLLKVKNVTADGTDKAIYINLPDGSEPQGLNVEGEAGRVANALNYLIKLVQEQAKSDPFANPPTK